jgi:predicted RNase H-like HicB family nuclease
MRYAVVIEKAARNYSAYVPDVPGCVATGKTVAQTMTNLREALEMHFADMRKDGDPIPDPEALCDYIDVDLTSSKTTDARLSKRSA